jgi:hypothetical protein
VDVTIDFVARGEELGEWLLVLVEEAPWADSADDDLRRIQDRLYGVLDAALDGAVAEKFPDSVGQRIVIQLDCYDGPDVELAEFFSRFSQGALSLPDYEQALTGNQFVSGVSFKLNLAKTEA